MLFILKLSFSHFLIVFLSHFVNNCADDTLPDAGTFYYLDAKEAGDDRTNMQIASCYFDCARDSRCQSVQNDEHSNKCNNSFSKDGLSGEDGSQVNVWIKDKKAAPCLAEHCYGEIEDQNQGTTEEIQLEETENNESNVVPNTTNIVPNTTEGVPPEEAKTIKTTEEPEDDSDVDDTELDEQETVDNPEEPVVEAGFSLRRRRFCYRRRRIYHCSDYGRRRRRRGGDYRRRASACKTVYGRRRVVCDT